MSTSVSVTEIRNAMRCPRVFALGRRGGRQVQFPITASSLGAAFHRLVAHFTRSAARSGALASIRADAAPERIEQALRDVLIADLAVLLGSSAAYRTMPAEVDDLAESLRQFARYVAAEVHRIGGRPAEALARFLAASERDVSATVAIPGGPAVLLRGRIDALHSGADRLDIVEYKLSSEDNEPLDRAQVALYYLLFRAMERRDVGAVILRFNPALVLTRLSGDAAQRLVEGQILGTLASMLRWIEAPAEAPPTRHSELCAACPLRSPCLEAYSDWLPSRDEPPASSARPRPGPGGDPEPPRLSPTPPAAMGAPSPDDEAPSREEAERIAARVVEILASQGVHATSPRAPVVGARLLTVELATERGRVRAMDRAAADVVHQLATVDGLQAAYSQEGGRRYLVVARTAPRPVRLPPLIARVGAWLAERPGRFVLGERADGEVAVGDLGEPASCHLLVGGMTGSGKSVLLRAIAASLVHLHPPDRLLLTLVDPKRVSFGPLARRLDAHLADPVCFEPGETIAMLEGLVEEMEGRYRLLLEAGVDNLDEYREVVSEPLPRRVVLVDEFQDLALDRAMREPFVAAVQRLGAKARAVGIHLILATQRPDAKTVPGGIKANLPGKVALRVQSAVNARIVLDAKGAEELLGQGDLLADLGRGLWRVQAPLVD